MDCCVDLAVPPPPLTVSTSVAHALHIGLAPAQLTWDPAVILAGRGAILADPAAPAFPQWFALLLAAVQAALTDARERDAFLVDTFRQLMPATAGSEEFNNKRVTDVLRATCDTWSPYAPAVRALFRCLVGMGDRLTLDVFIPRVLNLMFHPPLQPVGGAGATPDRLRALVEPVLLATLQALDDPTCPASTSAVFTEYVVAALRAQLDDWDYAAVVPLITAPFDVFFSVRPHLVNTALSTWKALRKPLHQSGPANEGHRRAAFLHLLTYLDGHRLSHPHFSPAWVDGALCECGHTLSAADRQRLFRAVMATTNLEAVKSVFTRGLVRAADVRVSFAIFGAWLGVPAVDDATDALAVSVAFAKADALAARELVQCVAWLHLTLGVAVDFALAPFLVTEAALVLHLLATGDKTFMGALFRYLCIARFDANYLALFACGDARTPALVREPVYAGDVDGVFRFMATQVCRLDANRLLPFLEMCKAVRFTFQRAHYHILYDVMQITRAYADAHMSAVDRTCMHFALRGAGAFLSQVPEARSLRQETIDFFEMRMLGWSRPSTAFPSDLAPAAAMADAEDCGDDAQPRYMDTELFFLHHDNQVR